MEEKNTQNIFLYSRTKLEISGVVDVCEFCDKSLELTLGDGYLGVDGDDLKIDYFSCDTGKVCIHGMVSAIYYYDKFSVTRKNRKRHS